MKEKAKKEYMGRIKLYADENIRYGIVSALRFQGINIKHAIDVKLRSKDDHAHFQYAKKTKRWLLTTDRDFLNNRNFPFEQIKGIIIVPNTGEDLVAGRVMAWLKYELVPSGKGIENCKVVLSENSAIFYFRREGKIYREKIDFA